MTNLMENQDFIYCIATLPNVLFAAKQSGLYRSTDGGKTWQDAYASLKLSIPLPTTFVATAKAGDRDYVFAAVEGNILRSLDDGQTWETVALETPAPLVAAIAVSPDFASDGTILAATMQDGIFRSTDRGVTWPVWNFGLYDPNINALAFVDAQTVVAGAQSGVFISANGGRSWRDTDFPIESAPVQCVAVGQDKVIYAGTQESGLFVSRDAGKTWETVLTGSVEQIHLHNGKIFILNDGVLQISSDGKHWKTHKTETEITTFCPEPLILGLANGEIVHE